MYQVRVLPLSSQLSDIFTSQNFPDSPWTLDSYGKQEDNWTNYYKLPQKKKKPELMKKTSRNVIIASEERKVGDENSL